jgi:hypothetical protein
MTKLLLAFDRLGQMERLEEKDMRASVPTLTCCDAKEVGWKAKQSTTGRLADPTDDSCISINAVECRHLAALAASRRISSYSFAGGMYLCCNLPRRRLRSLPPPPTLSQSSAAEFSKDLNLTAFGSLQDSSSFACPASPSAPEKLLPNALVLAPAGMCITSRAVYVCAESCDAECSGERERGETEAQVMNLPVAGLILMALSSSTPIL